MDRLDNIDLQVGVIDSNVDEMRHEIRTMNQNLLAFFHNQNFFPPPSQRPPQWRSEELMFRILCLVFFYVLSFVFYVLSVVFVLCFLSS